MLVALSTLSPSKKVLPSTETASRNLLEPKSPTSALVTKPDCSVKPRSSSDAPLFMVWNRSPLPHSATVFAIQSAAFSLAARKIVRVSRGTDAGAITMDTFMSAPKIRWIGARMLHATHPGCPVAKAGARDRVLQISQANAIHPRVQVPIRLSRFTVFETCQRPPRRVCMPRALSSPAMARRLVAPPVLMSAITGSRALASAKAATTERSAARSPLARRAPASPRFRSAAMPCSGADAVLSCLL